MRSSQGITIGFALGLDLGFKYEEDTPRSEFGLMKAIIDNADLLMGDDVPLRIEIGNVKTSNMLRLALLSIEGVDVKIFSILRALQKMRGSNRIDSHIISNDILKQLSFEIGSQINDTDNPEEIAKATSYGLTWLMNQNINYTI